MLDTNEELSEKIVHLNKKIRFLEKEVLTWKANHACEVSRARVLKERIDMPLERIKTYEELGELRVLREINRGTE